MHARGYATYIAYIIPIICFVCGTIRRVSELFTFYTRPKREHDVDVYGAKFGHQ